MKNKRMICAILCASMVCTSVAPTWATENGTTDAAVGAENVSDTESKAQEKEEVIYANTDANGNVTTVNVVNIWPGGNIVDYGDYSEVKVLNTTDTISQDGDKITLTSDAEKVYYQGTLENAELPWNISILYYLDGEEVDAEDLGGQTGALKIAVQITENENAEGDFYDYYALQANFTFDTNLCKNIVSEGATEANVGSDKQLTYTILPGKGLETEITADVTDFEMEAISINGVRLNLNVDRDSFDTSNLDEAFQNVKDAAAEFDDGADDLIDGADDLDDGAQELNDGASELKDGAEELLSGAGTLDEGAQNLVDGAKKVKDGAASLYSGAATLSSGAATLSSGTVSLAQGITALADSASSTMTTYAAAAQGAQAAGLAEQQVVGYLGTIAGGIVVSGMDAETGAVTATLSTDAVQAMTALSQAATAAGAANVSDYISSVLTNSHNAMQGAAIYQTAAAFYEGAQKLESGASQVSSGAASLASGANELANGASSLNSGAATLYDGTVSLKSGTADLKAGLEELTGGTSDLLDGTATLKDGTSKLKDGTQDLKDGTTEFVDETDDIDTKMDDKIDEMIDDFKGSDYQVTSFVSEKNENVASVQFVIKTAAIEKPEEVAEEEVTADESGFFAKLLALFRRN